LARHPAAPRPAPLRTFGAEAGAARAGDMSSPASPAFAAALPGSPGFAPLSDWLSAWMGGAGGVADGGASAGGEGESAPDSACGLPAADDAFWRRDGAAVAADALARTRLYDAPREAELVRLRAAGAQSAALLSSAGPVMEQRRALLVEVRPSRGRHRLRRGVRRGGPRRGRAVGAWRVRTARGLRARGFAAFAPRLARRALGTTRARAALRDARLCAGASQVIRPSL